jgi:serine/threonine protein kinase
MMWELRGYEPIAELGQGSMGRVVLARHASLNRLVAVKQLHVVTSSAARSRLRREASALALLESPHVVRFLGLESEAEDLFLIMEYVEGAALSQVIASRRLSTPDALAVLSQLAAGLSDIHSNGVIHRDLKPSNVLLSFEGVCKLSDFGLARLIDATSGNPIPMTVLTKEGLPLGTAAYMSPEAVLGERALDQRADLYALAVISYYLLLGRLPFPDSLDLLPMLSAQLNEVPPAPEDVDPGFPASVAAPVMKALQKDRDDRYESVDAFWLDLENAAARCWPGWLSDADLAALVDRNSRHRDASSLASNLSPASLPVLDLVPPVMPKLAQNGRRWALLISVLAGVGVSLGVLELVHRIH